MNTMMLNARSNELMHRYGMHDRMNQCINKPNKEKTYSAGRTEQLVYEALFQFRLQLDLAKKQFELVE